MSEIYRLAEPSDAERLVDVIYDAYITIRELELQWPAAHADLALVEENIVKNACYVLEKEGQIVATLTLSKETTNRWNSEYPFLKWFAVHPDAQGSGFGTKLLTWVEEVVIRDEVGASAVTLATAEKHPWLLNMYERKGYERIDAIDRGNGDGTMYLLRKIVNPHLYHTERLGHHIGGTR
ncbi:GNAT family N-acetyltransferase [Paenibacillus whitsoniae]|uniref:GNAT family N-acetyltransferase n=1 Tax=Paenibacillus whitsoniae TaxID=2496558 RepID=A0A430JGW5_9BACL|nr:GNAT family N-acetyltransferase [Paenibacillus whitsoniae]RTE10236.1 GNAT family N-acetyltransferase [Paenibacillus whitsoniae]